MHHEEITIAVFIVRDEKGRTPYAVAGDKETRNEFRRFMACHPDRYDYVKAQVCFVKSPVSSVIFFVVSWKRQVYARDCPTHMVAETYSGE